VGISPDGALTVSGSQDSSVRLWTTFTERLLNTWVAHTGSGGSAGQGMQIVLVVVACCRARCYTQDVDYCSIVGGLWATRSCYSAVSGLWATRSLPLGSHT
jgi:WD40 repeat protein